MAKEVDWESLSEIYNRLQDSPIFFMKQVTQKWEKSAADILVDFDVTTTQIEILGALGMLMKDGKPVTQRDLSESIRRDKNTVSEVLKTLEKKGYITRSESESDKRAKSLILTEKGLMLVEKAMAKVLLKEERFFSDRSDRDQLKRLLKKYL
jgi:DNA-binding MarR family transcriptional regulator